LKEVYELYCSKFLSITCKVSNEETRGDEKERSPECSPGELSDVDFESFNEIALGFPPGGGDGYDSSGDFFKFLLDVSGVGPSS